MLQWLFPGRVRRWNCIYLTPSLRLAEAAIKLLERSNIRVRPVTSLDRVRALADAVPNAALITESVFLDGNWEDAVAMGRSRAPSIPVIVIMREFDGDQLVRALKSGAYDVLVGTVTAARIARTLVNALQRDASPRP